MGSRINRWINADITNPTTQNITIYIITYVLSIFLSAIPYIGLFASKDQGESVFWQTLADCIVPATITLTAGTVIQNIACAIQQRIGHCMLTYCSGLAACVYTLLYTALRSYNSSCFAFIICAVSLLISSLNIHAISQIERAWSASPSQ